MLGIVNPNVVSVEAIRKNFKDDHRDLCAYCGHSHKRGKRNCPAYGKTCDKCSGKNHFKTMCKGRSTDSGSKSESRCDSRRSHGANRKNKCSHRCNVHDIDIEEECHDDMEDLTDQVQSLFYA